MKIVAVIPIKLNNERLPGKNTMLLGDKPLISYCIEMLSAINEISSIYVYCSSADIKTYLPDHVTFQKRPDFLDLPTANFTQIFESFMRDVDADIYVYAHATAPFISSETVRREIGAVQSGVYDSAFCAERIQDFLWRDGEAVNFDPSNVPRSQDLPVVYRETSGVYVFKKEVFETYRRRIGTNPYIAEVGLRDAIDINTAEDFSYAKALLDFK
jgi:CMP-N-acetylneuraminic acid synthetase